MEDSVDAIPADARYQMQMALRPLLQELASAIAPRPTEDTPHTARAAMAAQHDLATMTAYEFLRRFAVGQINVVAHRTGRHRSEGVKVSYADLGGAIGITRQAARERWPGILSAPESDEPRLTPAQAMERPENEVPEPQEGDQAWVTWASASPDPLDVSTWTWRRATVGPKAASDPPRWKVVVENAEVATIRSPREIWVSSSQD
jgi:hypothetical protein